MSQRNHVFSGRNAPIPFPAYFPKRIGKVAGCRVWDRDDGSEYIDLWMGFGSLLFGHADSRSAEAASRIVREHGFAHSYCHDGEAELAERLAGVIPSAEFCRFAVTGQEATSYAVRMARAHTGRDRIMLVHGGYHGTNDATGFRSPAGIPSASAGLITLVPFGDATEMARLLDSGLFAAFMLEPVLGNNTVVRPPDGYLASVRDACTRSGTTLIFDEVMTGFRNNLGGAQRDFAVTPDLSTFGKALGGGVPISVVCGSESAMSVLYPSGPVAQEGTFYGNPLAVRMALETFDRYREESTISVVSDLTRACVRPTLDWVDSSGAPVRISTYGGMFSISFLTDKTSGDALSLDDSRYERFVEGMWRKGFLPPPIQSESAFLSVAHVSVRERLEEALLLSVREAAE